MSSCRWAARFGTAIALAAGVLASAWAAPPRFLRGDSNADASVNVTDPIHSLRYLFSSGDHPPCLDAADANDDGHLNLADPLHTLSFLFLSGARPPPPWPTCGGDPTTDALPCLSSIACIPDPPSGPAPHLEEYNERGEYAPYYGSGDMHRPRYLHKYILNKGGQPFVFGGSDERGYSGLDTVEIFDQTTFDKDAPRPPSVAGQWIDTNFEGDPVVFANGPRIHFTLDLLADGRVLVVGGCRDLLRSSLYEQAEIFDPELRTFESLEEKMVDPRFRHTSVQLSDGSILFIGGQIAVTVTILDDRIPPDLQEGGRQETRFITTPFCEVFSPNENKFARLTFPDTDRPSKLNTPRGRADHATGRLAGADGVLGSSDDVFLVAGGFQSMSGQFAPDNKFPWNVARGLAVGSQSFEFFDPITRSFTQVSNVSLDSPKLNTPHILNAGQFNDLTIDGVRGMGNMVFITHGSVDAACPVTEPHDVLLVATYTGFGPAGGFQLFRIIEDVYKSHIEGMEYSPTNLVARCATNPVAMPRALQTVPGAGNCGTWFFTTAGVDIFLTPAGCVFNYSSPQMLAGGLFDPFYSQPAVSIGLSARDLRSQRSPTNPYGVIGCWLTADGAIPTTDLANFGTTPTTGWARRIGATRVWGTLIPLAGEDGIIYSADDRVLLAGGGTDYGDPVNVGGEPTAPSTEIFIMPGSLNKSPSP